MQCVGYGDDIDNNIVIALLLALAMGNRCWPLSGGTQSLLLLPVSLSHVPSVGLGWVFSATLAKITPAPRPPKVCQCWHPW